MRQVLIDEEKKMNSNERKFETRRIISESKREREGEEMRRKRKKTTNDQNEPIKILKKI